MMWLTECGISPWRHCCLSADLRVCVCVCVRVACMCCTTRVFVRFVYIFALWFCVWTMGSPFFVNGRSKWLWTVCPRCSHMIYRRTSCVNTLSSYAMPRHWYLGHFVSRCTSRKLKAKFYSAYHRIQGKRVELTCTGQLHRGLCFR